MPALNQVNLVSCCKMPEDLVELAKINNVQLTTHNDPKGKDKIVFLLLIILNYILRFYLYRDSNH